MSRSHVVVQTLKTVKLHLLEVRESNVLTFKYSFTLYLECRTVQCLVQLEMVENSYQCSDKITAKRGVISACCLSIVGPLTPDRTPVNPEITFHSISSALALLSSLESCQAVVVARPV